MSEESARRLPPLRLVVPLVATSLATAFSAPVWWQSLTSGTYDDFHEYYVAAQLVLQRGWDAPYNLAVFPGAIRAATGVADAFTTSPLTVVLAIPFTFLSFRVGLLAWTALGVAAAGAAWSLNAPGTRLAKLLLLTLATSLWLFTFALQTANVLLFVLGLLGVSAWLLRRGSDWEAGAVLALAFLKPQDAVLLPICLLLIGRWRAAAACAAGAAMMLAVSVALLGPAGIHDYLASLRTETARSFYSEYTLQHQLGAGRLAPVVAVAVGAATFAAAWRRRDRGTDAVLAIGIVGCLLAAAYLNPEDLTLLLLASWLYLRCGASRAGVVALVASWGMLLLGHLVGARGVVAVEAAWLAAFLVLPAPHLFAAEAAPRPARIRAVSSPLPAATPQA